MTQLTKYGRPRDSQRQKIYSSERRAFPDMAMGRLGATWTDFEDAVRWVRKVQASAWWRKRYPEITPGTLVVGKANRGAHCEAGGHRINLSRWAYREEVILHEMAHVIVERTYAVGRRHEVTWHGWEFAKTFLELVERFLGKEHAARLRDEFRKNGVRYKAPRKVTMNAEQRAAAGARLAAARAAKRQEADHDQHAATRPDADAGEAGGGSTR